MEFFIDGVNIGTDTAWPFSTTWVPQEDGNFTLSVVATSAEGIQELHIEKLYVEELIGMPPDGTTTLIPNNLTQRVYHEWFRIDDSCRVFRL